MKKICFGILILFTLTSCVAKNDSIDNEIEGDVPYMVEFKGEGDLIELYQILKSDDESIRSFLENNNAYSANGICERDDVIKLFDKIQNAYLPIINDENIPTFYYVVEDQVLSIGYRYNGNIYHFAIATDIGSVEREMSVFNKSQIQLFHTDKLNQIRIYQAPDEEGNSVYPMDINSYYGLVFCKNKKSKDSEEEDIRSFQFMRIGDIINNKVPESTPESELLKTLLDEVNATLPETSSILIKGKGGLNELYGMIEADEKTRTEYLERSGYSENGIKTKEDIENFFTSIQHTILPTKSDVELPDFEVIKENKRILMHYENIDGVIYSFLISTEVDSAEATLKLFEQDKMSLVSTDDVNDIRIIFLPI